jgi:alpha-L-fucosidase
MTFDPATGGWPRDQAAASDNWMADHRARIALEESERLERKQQELLQQTSELSTPAERIRIWERRHGLTLPRDANHRLVKVVAHQTDLALDQVREEQQRRVARIDGEPAVVLSDDSGRAT